MLKIRPSLPAAPDVAIFICSSDNRLDVLQRVLPSLTKFWPDRSYPTYVGLNSPQSVSEGITTLVAKPSDWRKETLEQISQLLESHLIILLDDFLIRAPVAQKRVAAMVQTAVRSDLPYLRLLPLRKSIFERFRRTGPLGEIVSIPDRRPYYSGLQIAVWNKAHLCSLLGGSGTIWDFEHQSHPGVIHRAIAGPAPIKYSHLVEKGRWLPYARFLLRNAGFSPELGKRPVWPFWMHLRLVIDELRFLFLGYANH